MSVLLALVKHGLAVHDHPEQTRAFLRMPSTGPTMTTGSAEPLMFDTSWRIVR
jgi:hypothetical protein